MSKTVKFYIALLILNIASLNAQSNLKITVTYKHILNLNSSAPTDELGLKAILTTDGKNSFYVYNKVYNDTTLSEDKIITIKTGKTGEFTRFYNQDRVGEGINKNFTLDTLILRQFVMKKAYIIKDTLPKFDWIIRQESKKINNILCQKADLQYKGRKYEAWFTLSVPISDGPWKFHGLPGLILEICDESKEVKFLFDNIEISSEFSTNPPPFKGEKVNNQQELQKIIEDEDKKIIEKIESSMPKGYTGGTSVKYPKPIEYN
jgi:GLPGLI family protein